MKKKICCMFLAVMLTLTQIPFVQISFAQETATETREPTQDENGYYQIGTAEELFWFADFVEKTAEEDVEAANEKGESKPTRTLVKGKLVADINLNPFMSVSYDDETGKVTLTNGENSYKMGTGLKGTKIGRFEDLSGNIVSSETVEERLGIVKWTPIGTSALPFVGYFDGNGYTVDGLYINEHEARGDDKYLNNDVGFFGNTNTNDTTNNYIKEDYKIKNFSIGENSLVVGYDSASETNKTSYQSVGAIVGNPYRDSIYRCENNAIVVGMGYSFYYKACTGGLVGHAIGAIDECINRGTVISPNAAGGIVGFEYAYNYFESESSVYKCVNYGKVLTDMTNAESYAGGIAAGAGYRDTQGGDIFGSCNKGDVEGGIAAGIVAQVSNNTYVLRCSNFGSINASYVAGGIVGWIQYYLNRVDIRLCYNAGEVNYVDASSDVTDKYIYPLVGIANYNSYIAYWLQNCYNNSDICPATDETLAPKEVLEVSSTEGCHSVPTAAFNSGEVAYNMENNVTGLPIYFIWTQKLEYPKEEGKIVDDYPTVFGEKNVYIAKVNYRCCHDADTEEYAEHSKEIYANSYDDVIAEHSYGEDKVCTHCNAYCGAPEFLTEDTRLKSGKVGDNYFTGVHLSERSTNNGPNWGSPEYEMVSGNLPKGLYINGWGSNLNIDGIPEEAGNYTFTVKVTNNHGFTEKTFTLTVKSADKLEIYTEKLDNATVGEKYWGYFTASNNATWSAVDETKLPDGLTMDDYSISGTPTAAGQYTFEVRAEAYGQTVTKEVRLIVEPEGGCTHENKALIDEVEPTCKENGTLEYWYCKDCECNFEDEECKNEIHDFPKNIETVSNHVDNDTDGICDFCGKAMPLFMQIKSESLITAEGTYAFISKIGDKYYALALPQEGFEYSDKETMPVCEVEPDENGAFTFNELKNKNAITVKTEFCTEDGNLDAGKPRYSLSTIIGKFAYGLNGDYSSATMPVFALAEYSDYKYGWHLSLDNNKNVTISSVYHEIWSENNTREMLKAYKATDESYYMSLYDTSKNDVYDVQLYKMIDLCNTGNDISCIIIDNQGTFSNNTEFTIDNAALSNVSGISNSITEECIAQKIGDVAAGTSLVVESYAEIELNEAELLYDNAFDSIKYSLTPYIKVTDGEGNVVCETEILDGELNGNKITVTLSVGEGYPEQIIHYKQDGQKEYFYSEHSKEVVYGGEKSFKMIYGANGNFVSFEITSFSEIEILSSVKIEDDDDKEDDVTVENAIVYEDNTLKISVKAAGEYAVVFVNYNGDEMIGVNEVPTELNKGTNNVKIPENVKLSKGDKIFLWNKLSDLVPLCEEKTVE